MIKVLSVHNYYQQRGGEDEVFAAEKKLLELHGDEVITYTESNAQTKKMSKVHVFLRSIWSWKTYIRITQLIKEFHPDVVHVHNIFFMISPSIYYACHHMRIPVVQSLHNPRLVCPAASLQLSGQICENCIDKKFAWPGIINKCYHNSSLATFAIAFMIWFHHKIKTWNSRVDRYIVFTDFYYSELNKSCLNLRLFSIKPHFVYPDPGQNFSDMGTYALFIGRLDYEKGIFVLLDAVLKAPDVRFCIRGGGQNLDKVMSFIIQNNLKEQVQIIEDLSKEEMFNLIRKSRFLIWPSLGYYESFGLVAIEAYACGKPIIASNIGVPSEIVIDNKTGLHFIAGDSNDLAAKINWAWGHPNEMSEMGKNARVEYERKFTAEKNYLQLIEIYKKAIDSNKGRTY
jgi:glycosyltransferase involved in cell wall biosynthesis